MLPDPVLGHLDAAFSGDLAAAERLIFAAPNEFRGDIAFAAYLLGVPNPAYRAIIDSVWNHDHWGLLDTVGDRRRIRRMFRAAKFSVPLAGKVLIYRGGARLPRSRVEKGLAWTTSRDVACWFATHWVNADLPDQVVLAATIDAGEIVYYSNERYEHEVVTKCRPQSIAVDPDPGSWVAAAERLLREREITRG